MRRGGRLFLLLGVVIAALAALVLYVVLVNAPANQGGQVLNPTAEPRRRIVTALVNIPANTILTDTESFLTTEEIPESEYNANPNQYFLSPAALERKVTLRAIGADERIRQDDVADAGLSLQIPEAQEGQPRPKAFAMQVNNLSGVADQIRPGDFVDVLATFNINRLTFRPSFNDDGSQTITEQEVPSASTKTLVQNVQVLKVLKPQAPPSGTPTPGQEGAEGPPQTDASGQPVQPGQEQGATSGDTFTPGTWLLVLALTDQQAEIVKYSVEQGNGITLVLRGRGDTAVETTVGATLDLLISQFGLPLPNPVIPALINNNQLSPVNTAPQAPAPAAPAPTPAPAP